MDNKGLKWVSNGGKGREGQNLTKSRGGKKCVNSNSLKSRQKCVKHIFFTKLVSILPFEVCYMIKTWSIFIIYMITAIKGYADDIFQVISIFHIYRSKFGRKSYKLGRNC